MAHNNRGQTAAFCALSPVVIPIRLAVRHTTPHNSWWSHNRGQGAKKQRTVPDGDAP